jgi:hypothetical protein
MRSECSPLTETTMLVKRNALVTLALVLFPYVFLLSLAALLLTWAN